MYTLRSRYKLVAGLATIGARINRTDPNSDCSVGSQTIHRDLLGDDQSARRSIAHLVWYTGARFVGWVHWHGPIILLAACHVVSQSAVTPLDCRRWVDPGRRHRGVPQAPANASGG